MKIILCSSFVPFINGGARFIVEWLQEKLQETGHQVERVYLPHVDAANTLFQQMMAYRWLDLSDSADRIICFRPPAHVIPHPNKVLWFIHHIRVFYDLWGTEYCPVPHTEKWQNFRQTLMEADTNALKEAKQIFTNSKCVSNRLMQYNQIESEVLYPPLLNPEAFQYANQNDEIIYVSRIEHHKRQHLIVEAMKYTQTPVKLRLCGKSSGPYGKKITQLIKQHNLHDKVIFEDAWVSETTKSELLANCLAAAYIPLDEDSYGYPSLEASHAAKPIITTTDSNGVTELVIDRQNGFVCEPNPQAIAAVMDELYQNRKLAKKMGEAAKERVTELPINWPHVITRLLS